MSLSTVDCTEISVVDSVFSAGIMEVVNVNEDEYSTKPELLVEQAMERQQEQLTAGGDDTDAGS